MSFSQNLGPRPCWKLGKWGWGSKLSSYLCFSEPCENFRYDVHISSIGENVAKIDF